MPRPLGKEKILIVTGTKVGVLEAVYQVFDVLHHPAYETTPNSYISQGRLWECVCQCGNVILRSEHVLSNYLVRSCGCLRRNNRRVNYEEKTRKMEIAAQRRELKDQIKILRFKMKSEQIKDSLIRDEDLIDNIAAQLRSLSGRLAALSKRLNQEEKSNLSDKEREIRRQAWLRSNLGT